MIRIVAGIYKGKKLALPPQYHTRPATNQLRESIFNVLTHLTLPVERAGDGRDASHPKHANQGEKRFSFQGVRVLDLFAGSGAFGIEALSRGAQHVTFAEMNPSVMAVLQSNVAGLGAQAGAKCTLLQTRMPAGLKHQSVAQQGPYSLIFIAPPYEAGLYDETLQALAIACQTLLAPHGVLVVEHLAKTTIQWPQAFQHLKQKTHGQTQVDYLMSP